MKYFSLACTTGLIVIALTTPGLASHLRLSITSQPPATLAQFPSVFEDPRQFLQDFEARYMASGSMAPALEIDDRFIIDKHTYRTDLPQRGDIVLYTLPPIATVTLGVNPDALLHRIVGLPGEVVAVREGQLYIDDQPLVEPYLSPPVPIDYDYGPETIPDDAYFVLGDNRNGSFDSHIWGMLPRDSILGFAIGIYCPAERQIIFDPEAMSEKNQAIFGEVAAFFQENPAFCALTE